MSLNRKDLQVIKLQALQIVYQMIGQMKALLATGGQFVP
jgi:hypothetical protein